jgi:hypothetical protein
MTSRRLLAFALALLLGLAQHAALAHAIGHHLGHPPGATERVAAQTGGHQHQTPAQAAACDLDAVYAEVLGAAGTGGAPALTPDAPVADRVAIVFFSHPAANILAAAPRGPPAVSL